MKVTITLLSYDHGIIKQVIDVFAVASKESDLVTRSAQLFEMVSFFKEFMDKFHHGKEEKFVFPSVPSALLPEISELLMEHNNARKMLGSIAEELESRKDKVKFVQLCTKFVSHMSNHIDKEEGSAFPKIEQSLESSQDRQIYKEFDKYLSGFKPNFYKNSEEFAQRIQNEVLGVNYFKKIDVK